VNTREHIVTIVDGGYRGDAPLEMARRAVERGGRATLMVLFSAEDRGNIHALADAEALAAGEAEAIYIERTLAALTAEVGGSDTTAIVGVRPHEHRDLVEDALGTSDATSVVIPRRLAGRLTWRHAVTRARVPVVITPPRAA